MSDNMENVLKNELIVKYLGEDYCFKIPSVRDQIKIAAVAAKLRQDNDSGVNGASGSQLNYDPTTVVLTSKIATLLVLLKNTTASWVYSAGAQGPVMDIDKWPDEYLVMGVVDQFNIELDTFREAGNRPAESTV